ADVRTAVLATNKILTAFFNRTVEGDRVRRGILVCKRGELIDTRDRTTRQPNGQLKDVPCTFRPHEELLWFLRLGERDLPDDGKILAAYEDRPGTKGKKPKAEDVPTEIPD